MLTNGATSAMSPGDRHGYLDRSVANIWGTISPLEVVVLQ